MKWFVIIKLNRTMRHIFVFALRYNIKFEDLKHEGNKNKCFNGN